MNRIGRALCIVTGVVVGLPLVLYVYPAPDRLARTASGGPCAYVPVAAPAGDPARAVAGSVPSGHLVPSEALTPDERERALCSYVVPAVEPDRVRVLAGERPRDVPAGETWLVVQTRVDASRTTIGCSPWGLVFCSTPSGFPVMTR